MNNKVSRARLKRQKKQTLPRVEYTIGHTDHPVTQLTVQLGDRGSVDILEVSPLSKQRQISYERQGARGEKVLYSAPTADFGMGRDSFADLQHRFDHLLAVDTNTSDVFHQGHKISICSIYCVPDLLQSLSTEARLLPVACYLIADSDLAAVAEPIGWHLAISRHAVSALQRGRRVGLVVDHDREKHCVINDRSAAYHGNHYLPEGLALIYASDKSTETVANHLLRYCDKAANRVMELVCDGSVEQHLQHPPFLLGSAFCYLVGPWLTG